MNTESKRRSLWPYGLIITFAVFISWLATFAVIAVSGRMDLERPDYYEQEIRYQEQIDRRERTAGMAGRMTVAYEPALARVVLQIPAEHAGRKASGTVKFYRPSDASLDRDVRLEVDATGRQQLDVAGLQSGLWKCRVTWQVDGEEYFFDNAIVMKPGGS